MAFVYLHDNMQQYHSVKAVFLARKRFGFSFDTVQTDNGSEWFNRTLREECLGNYIPTRETLEQTQKRTEQYLDYYNMKRLHLGIQFMILLQKCSQGVELN